MEKLLTVALPIFALIFSGYGARRLRLLTAASFVGLNGFVYYFALPALLFVKIAQTPILRLFDWRLLAAYYAGGFTVFALTILLARLLFRERLAVLGLLGLAAAYPNVGYMGLPLLITAFGEAATFPVVLIFVADVLVTFSIGTALVEVGLGRGGRWWQAARTVAGGFARNPLLLAIALGAAVGLAGVPLHASLRAFAELLGGAALPCALFALGASLTGEPVARQAARDGATGPGGGWREVALVVGMKLALHPWLVWLAATRVFDLPPLSAAAAVLQASLPVAVSVFVLAQKHGLHVDRISTVVLVSTLASMVTVSALLALWAPP